MKPVPTVKLTDVIGGILLGISGTFMLASARELGAYESKKGTDTVEKTTVEPSIVDDGLDDDDVALEDE